MARGIERPVLDLLRRPRPWLLLTLLLAAASALQALRLLDATSLWADELSTVHKVFQLDLPAMLQYLRSDAHPPVYYLLMRLWGGVVPLSTASLRLLSWCCYGLGGLLMARQARELARWQGFERPWQAACLAALIAFCSPSPLHFALEGKGYSLMVLLLAAGLLLRQRWLTARSAAAGGALTLVGAAAALALAAATHYYAVFFLVALLLVDGVQLLRARPRRGALLAAEGLAVLPVLLWILWSYDQLSEGNGLAWIGTPGYGLFEGILSAFLGPFPWPKLVVLALVLGGLWVSGALRWQWPAAPPAGAAAADLSGLWAAAVMTVLVVLISLVRPLAYPRYFVVLLPALAVQTALWLAALRPQRAIAWILLLSLTTGAWLVAWQDAFAELQRVGPEAGARNSTNFRALSLLSADAPARYLVSHRKHAEASDFVLLQEGLLTQPPQPWRALTDRQREGQPLPDALLLAGTGRSEHRKVQRWRERLQDQGFHCTAREPLPAWVLIDDCVRR